MPSKRKKKRKKKGAGVSLTCSLTPTSPPFTAASSFLPPPPLCDMEAGEVHTHSIKSRDSGDRQKSSTFIGGKLYQLSQALDSTWHRHSTHHPLAVEYVHLIISLLFIYHSSKLFLRLSQIYVCNTFFITRFLSFFLSSTPLFFCYFHSLPLFLFFPFPNSLFLLFFLTFSSLSFTDFLILFVKIVFFYFFLLPFLNCY